MLFNLDITKCPLASIHTEITKKNVSNMKYSRSELIAILDTRKKVMVRQYDEFDRSTPPISDPTYLDQFTSSPECIIFCTGANFCDLRFLSTEVT